MALTTEQLNDKLANGKTFIKNDFHGGPRKTIRQTEKFAVHARICLEVSNSLFCPFCSLNKTEYQICHIQSQKNNGSGNWENLGVGCSDCNGDMSSTNADVYLNNPAQFAIVQKFAMAQPTEIETQNAMIERAKSLVARARSIQAVKDIRENGLTENLKKLSEYLDGLK